MTDKGGRPEWQPSKTQRDDARLYIACGMAEEDIARTFGVCLNTLRKHLGDELATGRARKRAEILRMLQKSAKAGNVSAQKHLEQMTALSATSRHEVARKSPAIGKKEEAVLEALHPDISTPMGELIAKRSASVN